MVKIKDLTILPERIPVGLFISGMAAKKNIIFTNEDLENQKKDQVQTFSVYDNHEDRESRAIEEGRGFPLADYLALAGVDSVEEIRTISVDGFESIITEMGSARYYFPGLKEHDPEGREARDAFVSFYKNGKEVKFYPHPTLMFGQQGIEDKNKDFFAKGMRSMIVDGRERAFYVRGTGLRCDRYFSMDELFALEADDTYQMAEALLTDAAGNVRKCPAVCLSELFWTARIEVEDLNAEIFAQDADGSKEKVNTSGEHWIVFIDDEYKQLAYWDGSHLMTSFAGFQVGEARPRAEKKGVRVPQTVAAEDAFYIRVQRQGEEICRYNYSLEELQTRFAAYEREEEFLYYNHNIAGGQGGNRLVTGHGWLLSELLELLPEIPDLEYIENGGLLFQVFTRDNYKEKIALEGSELTAFRFLLTFEQDQRTEQGMERSDTSAWDAPEKVFEPIKGNTPFRIYCGKSSANPAVYKNVEGITVTLW